MATFNNIHNSTYLSSGLSESDKTLISSTVTYRSTDFNNNLTSLSNNINALSSTGFLYSGVDVSTSSTLKYWLSGDKTDSSKGYFYATGNSLPIYNHTTSDFDAPSKGLSFNQFKYFNQNYNGQILQFDGTFTSTPTKLKYDWGTPSLASFKLTSLTTGDNTFKVTLNGSVTIKEVQDKSYSYWETYNTISGSFKSLTIDLLKEGSTTDYYHVTLDFDMKWTTTNQQATVKTKINSISLTLDSGGTLLSGTNLGLYLNDSGEFTNSKGVIITNDLATALTWGNDTITGTSENDFLAGGNGVDSLSGKTGADYFVWHALSETGLGSKADKITDFKSSEGDKIDLSEIDANTSLAEYQAFNFVSSIASTRNYNGIVWFDSKKSYLNISTDTDSAAEYQIALTGVTQLQASDLVLYPVI